MNFLRRLALEGGEKKTWWQPASRCCWNRARPWHASELVSFLVSGYGLISTPVQLTVQCTSCLSCCDAVSACVFVWIRASEYRPITVVSNSILAKVTAGVAQSVWYANRACCTGWVTGELRLDSQRKAQTCVSTSASRLAIGWVHTTSCQVMSRVRRLGHEADHAPPFSSELHRFTPLYLHTSTNNVVFAHSVTWESH